MSVRVAVTCQMLAIMNLVIEGLDFIGEHCLGE